MQGTGASGYVIEDGKGEAQIAVVAEAPGEDEALAGRPLVGKSGETWNRIVSRTDHPFEARKLNRDDFWHSNVLRCRPLDNHLTGAPYEFSAIATCRPYLEGWLRAKKPKAILALGNQSLRWFTGQWGIEKLQGYIWKTEFGPVIGTYHPSYIQRGKWGLTKMVQLAITRALEVARNGIPVLEKKYQLHPSPMDVLRFCEDYERGLKENPELPLSFDIETPYAGVLKDEVIDPEDEEISLEDDASYTINRISFSFRPGEAITFPWVQPFPLFAKRLLGSAGPKIGWNSLNFDIPRLEANGCLVNGLSWDGMDMWHFLEPGLPMGLKYVATVYCPDMPAWKLQSRSDPEWYSAADADVALRCVSRIRDLLLASGRWATFNRHFVQLADVLRKMSRRGVLVDKAQRDLDRGAFMATRDSLRGRILGEVPEELRPVEKIYKSSEEKLRAGGKWVEGKMIQVMEMAEEPVVKPPKPPKMKKEKKPRASRRSKKQPGSPAPLDPVDGLSSEHDAGLGAGSLPEPEGGEVGGTVH